MGRNVERAGTVERVVKTPRWVEEITCDAEGCDYVWHDDNDEGDADEDRPIDIHLIQMGGTCGYSHWKKWFCPEHWDVWEGLCKLLGVDPDQLGRPDDDDD